MSAPVDEVSDNINWTTRVAKELNADGEWFENGWGEIFARDVPRAPADKIAKIEKELHELERKTGSAWKTTHRAAHAERSHNLEIFGRSKHARVTARDLTPANPYYD